VDILAEQIGLCVHALLAFVIPYGDMV